MRNATAGSPASSVWAESGCGWESAGSVIRAVAGPVKEPGRDELARGPLAQPAVDAPQAARLRGGETQTRHLEVLAADAADQAFGRVQEERVAQRRV
jgi:hypothetical protein